MVDRESRDKLANLLQGFLDGNITVEELIKSAPQDSKDYIIPYLMQNVKRLSIGDLSPMGEKIREPLIRSIEFLRTDQEYRWVSKSAEWSAWKSIAMAIPIALVAIVVILTGIIVSFVTGCLLQTFVNKLGIGLRESDCAIIILLAFLGVYFVIARIINKMRGKDIRYWPFYGPKDYEAARKDPF